MSASLPPQLQTYAQGQVVYQRRPTLQELLTPRRQHIPTFYRGHPDLSAVIEGEDGRPLLAPLDGRPVTVGEVPVERRWAIGSYDRSSRTWNPGVRLLPEQDYTHLHQRWILDYYDLVREKTGIDAVKFEGRIEVEAVPAILDFVLEEVDPDDETKTRTMHYRNATQGSKPAVLYDSHGEKPRPRDEVLLETYRQAPERLTEKERREVESRLVPADDPMRTLTALSGKLVRGEISAAEFASESQKVAEASDAPEVGKGRVVMACGKKVWPSQQEAHLEACGVCQPGE
jgi:hypothetical protein